MKFESFCKKYMPYVSTIKIDGKNWACSGRVYMMLGENARTIGRVLNNDKVLDAIMHDADWGQRDAVLLEAFLPKPDGKASDIIRRFSDGIYRCDISNACFGLIEKKDMCVVATWYDDEKGRDSHALLIGAPVTDVDDFEPTGIILEVEN